MPSSNFMRSGYLKFVAVILVMALGSCIDDSLKDCPDPAVERDKSQLIYIRVADVLTGSDITATEQLQEIMVYIFDQQQMLVDTVPYTIGMLRADVPVDVTGKGLEGGYVAVWANLGNVDDSDPRIGERMADLTVGMAQDLNRTDYYISPGDIFFGYGKLAFSPLDADKEADTVWVMRKNSRLNVTVRGLPSDADPDDYYFRIRTLFSGYDYLGTPQSVSRQMWETGTFHNDDFVCPEPYWMIHHPLDWKYTPQSNVSIDLYSIDTSRSDELIGSAVRDENGNYIDFEQGMTTNVLIVIDRQTGQLTVRMALTPWDEIYQWTTW